MRIIPILILIVILSIGCEAQNTSISKPNKVGGPFENGDFFYVDMPENIKSIDTSPGWHQEGQKICITGTIFEIDGITPAPNVILYYYHTDINGLYSATPYLNPKVNRHGSIRSWVKSDANGKYTIYTVRPGVYPDRGEPAHIHPAIKEPMIDEEYYIDDFVFDDDILLTTAKRKKMENRGGSGILRFLQKGDLLIAEKNIILGLNIPNYPKDNKKKSISGNEVGEDVISFTPFHAWGPDRGSKTCPICKYGRYQGILYLVGNKPDWLEIKKWLIFLESESVKREKYLKVYFVYGNETKYNKEYREKELAKIGRELNLEKVALTFVPSLMDKKSEINLNNFNPEVENTILLYKNRNIIGNYTDLKPTASNFLMIKKRLDETINELFYLSEPDRKN